MEELRMSSKISAFLSCIADTKLHTRPDTALTHRRHRHRQKAYRLLAILSDQEDTLSSNLGDS
jgi:hypothetical protein